jgi:penicillin-binding protein 2
VENIDICGKTNTAELYQNWRKKSTAKDHSIFVAFAPMENQKNSDSNFSENGGFGAIAGPIASLMIEKYLRQK